MSAVNELQGQLCVSHASFHLMTKKGLLKLQQNSSRDFPGGAVVKNLPANAGDMGSSPGPEDSTCTEQLSLCAVTTEPAL